MPRAKKVVNQQAQNNPVILRVGQESGEGESSTHFDMPEVGEIIRPEEGGMTPEAMAAAGKKDYADQLAFMEEKVKVVVHESQDPNAEPLPMMSVNGVNQFFVRGEEIWAKRKFVEVLARCKADSIKTGATFMIPSIGAEPVQRVTKTRSLKYPFDVREDLNPRGRAWLAALMQEDQLQRY